MPSRDESNARTIIWTSVRQNLPSVSLRQTHLGLCQLSRKRCLKHLMTPGYACRQRKPKQYEDMMLGEGMDGDYGHSKAGQRSSSDR